MTSFRQTADGEDVEGTFPPLDWVPESARPKLSFKFFKIPFHQSSGEIFEADGSRLEIRQAIMEQGGRFFKILKIYWLKN